MNEGRESGEQDDAGIIEALRPYLQLASGVTVARAIEFAQLFLAQTMPQEQAPPPERSAPTPPTGDVRDAARDEVSLALRRGDFVREDELSTMRREIERLEREVSDLRVQVAALGARTSGQVSAKPAKGAKGKGAKSTKESKPKKVKGDAHSGKGG